MPGKKQDGSDESYRRWVAEVNKLCKISGRPAMLSQFGDSEATLEQVEATLIEMAEAEADPDSCLDSMPCPHVTQ